MMRHTLATALLLGLVSFGSQAFAGWAQGNIFTSSSSAKFIAQTNCKTDQLRFGASGARGRGALVLDVYFDGNVVCQHIVDFESGRDVRSTEAQCRLPLLTGYATLKGYSRDGHDVAAVGFLGCDS